MKTEKDNDQLRDLFRQMPMENVSPEFEKNLMFLIQKEAVAQQKKKRVSSRVYTYISLTFGALFLISIPFILSLFIDIDFEAKKIDFSEFQNTFTKSFQGIEVHPLIPIVGFAVLILLLADLFLRKFTFHKHNYS